MKNHFFLLCLAAAVKAATVLFVITGLTGVVFAQSQITLDDAITKGAQDIQEKLSKGVKVVVLNFNSPTAKFSNYVLEEMIGCLASGGKLTVVDRQNLSLLQREMNFQLSGEVSEDSQQEIGKKLGAQSVVSGSMEDMGNYYRVRFRTIEVVSAAIQVNTSLNVRKDNQTSVLLSGAPASVQTSTTGGGSGTGYPNGLNFSTGRKVGAGFLNMIFGLGSFTMGDWVGGLIIAGAEVAGYLMMFNGFDSYYDDYYNLGSVIFGFVRPFSYDTALAKKNYYASSNPLEHIDIVLIPGNNGIRKARLSYKLQY